MLDKTLPPTFDVRQAAESSRRLAGRCALSDYERLMAETKGLGADNVLDWQAQLDSRPDQAGLPQSWLRLTVSVTLPLSCQRCLGLVDVAVQIDRDFRFVASEAVAEQQDDESEEDLLVQSRAFDLAGLIEDEVLLALPLVPRHEVCPQAPALSSADADFDGAPARPHPFAALAGLKGKKGV